MKKEKTIEISLYSRLGSLCGVMMLLPLDCYCLLVHADLDKGAEEFNATIIGQPHSMI